MSGSVEATLRDLTLGADAIDALDRYTGALLRQTATTNLTAARTIEAVCDHVRDSLALAGLIGEPHVDIGSGGGFPAIPLAIVTRYRMTLVESIGKKAAFLEAVARDLGLPVEVACARAEDLGREASMRGSFASATARAVGALTTVLELAIPLLAIGGVAVIQRGTIESNERRAAQDAVLVLGASIEAELEIPAGGIRRVLIVRKIAQTNARFPRRAGMPAKKPLCLPTRAL
ncbi:MAG: 16S rRNA (guanine(527)-N(7))-methyltransferase RsmG [Vulcanimicrobiaceae bacterium]